MKESRVGHTGGGLPTDLVLLVVQILLLCQSTEFNITAAAVVAPR